ncbi:MAG: 7-carboxy-7-deazaguanine synthase QueE [Endomicrobiales bacterium]|nr:7-carboxy-7-deazaguanine synthase QueE [Endomicrobiales bacterium]
MTASFANIYEIFCSFQGEGVYLAQPQIFVRFSGCNLECFYCDTQKTRQANAGKKYSVTQTLEKIIALKKSKLNPEVVSFTGGEPMLHADFIAVLAPMLKKSGLKIYLETNGTMPQEFEKIKKYIDVVAMDIKLPSACGKELWQVHKAFLKSSVKKVFVKIVLENKTTVMEFSKAVSLVGSVSKNIPVVLQPATLPKNKKINLKKLWDFYNLASNKLINVRIVEQMHKYWSVR